MFCRFVGATGQLTANDGGVRSVTRNGTADYTVELARAVHASEVSVSVSPIDATPRGVSIEHLSPTTIRIRFDR